MKFKSLYINGRPLKSLSINGRKVWGKQEEDDKPWLKFTAEADGSSVAMKKQGAAPEVSLVYSTNGGNTWQDFIVGETTVNLDAGDSMYIKASKDDEIVNIGMASSILNYNKFVIGGLVKASGNIMTLLRGDGELDSIPSSRCFNYLFDNCTSLVQAPELPATTLMSNCYSNMFSNCTSLVQAPELPATTLMSNCYSNMFNGCSNLNAVQVGYTGEYNSSYFYKWLSNVAPNGNLEIASETLVFPQGESGVPYTWTLNGEEMPEYDGLRFIAQEANSTIKIEKNVSSAPNVYLMYSTTKGVSWQTLGTNTITLENVGDEVCIVATSTNSSFGDSSSGACNQFKMTGKVCAKGNIMSLLYGIDWNSKLTIPSKGCFYQLFANCTSLTQSPELPATTLTTTCYNSMFNGCTGLTQAPELPATTLTSNCYSYMFNGCTKLNEIKIGYTGNFSSTNFNSWVTNVSPTGNFYYNGSATTRGASAIPNGWTIQTF